MHRLRARPRGLTLIEIVVVITIVSMLMAAVTVSALTIHADSQRKAAKVDLRTVLHALDLYRLAKGRYPPERPGLQALLDARIVKELPTDPWGTPYAYALQDGEPLVTCFGRDGQPGGEGADADLSSRALTEP
jgi:general secretion pathway protein G